MVRPERIKQHFEHSLWWELRADDNITSSIERAASAAAYRSVSSYDDAVDAQTLCCFSDEFGQV
uniref:Uncharacterized protein n=1 Tax=uncultured Bacteroidota bacterium TaxID=152509 RepID=H5SFX9_9BACT|nr:hypothetical protein HGMM_F23B02C04 [uncultured Bacteroidetes bacterium]